MQTHWRPGGCAGRPACWRTAPAFCSKMKKRSNVCVINMKESLTVKWPEEGAPFLFYLFSVPLQDLLFTPPPLSSLLLQQLLLLCSQGLQQTGSSKKRITQITVCYVTYRWIHFEKERVWLITEVYVPEEESVPQEACRSWARYLCNRDKRTWGWFGSWDFSKRNIKGEMDSDTDHNSLLPISVLLLHLLLVQVQDSPQGV